MASYYSVSRATLPNTGGSACPVPTVAMSLRPRAMTAEASLAPALADGKGLTARADSA